MKQQHTVYYILLLFCLVGNYSFAQLDNLFEYLEPVKTFSVDNYGIFEDSEGYIWIYSEQGLERFSFDKSKRVVNRGGEVANDIWNVFKDNNERIWLVHRGNSASYLKNGKIHSLAYPKGVKGLVPYSYSVDKVFFKKHYEMEPS